MKILVAGALGLLAGCASMELPSAGRTINPPLLTEGYTLTLGADGRGRLVLDWPEKFGKSVQDFAVADLDLTKVRFDKIPGGAFATNWQVTIPTRGNRLSIFTESWEQYYDSDPSAQPRGSRDDELIFHSPSKAAAQRVVEDLRRTTASS